MARKGYKQTPEHIERRIASWRRTIEQNPALMRSDAMAKRAKKHGMRGTRTYTSWISMRQRCENPNLAAYARYGGRGIKVCERWGDFANFYADMGERPEGCSLDRIDGDGDYEPGNCRWATAKTQSRNWRESNHRIAHEGTFLTIAEWSERTGIEHHVLQYRLRAGWSAAAALTTPANARATV